MNKETLITTAIYYVSFIVLGMTLSVVGPALPGLAEQTHMPLTALGIVFVARESGIMLMSFLGGRLFDHLPGHRIIAVTLLAGGVVMAAVPFADNIPALIAVFALIGLTFGGLDIGGNMLIVLLHGRKVAPFMNGMHFCFGIGASLAPIIVAQVMQRNGAVQWAFWIIAAFVLPLIVLFLLQPSPQLRLQTQEEKDGTAQKPWEIIFAFAFFLMMYVGAEVSFGGWISSYLVVLGESADTTAAYLASGYWVTFTLGRLLSIPLTIRISAEKLLAAASAGGLFFLVLMAVFPGSLLWIWIGACGFGFCAGPIFPNAIALAGKRMRLTGQITGWIMLGASLGSMSIPWLIGQLIGWVGPQGFVYAVSASMALTVLALVFILRMKTEALVTPAPVLSE